MHKYNLVGMAVKTVTTNRKAYHNYHVGETVEAGLVLTGTEIKSIRTGMVNLGDAYVRSEGGELWLWNAHIARYDAGSYMSHEPMRARKLLLHRKEIRELISKMAEKGLTMVPLRLYLKDSLAKVEVALARGKKLYDKRETIIRRETALEMARVMKERRGGRER
ncbi:MAG: SsrA-binding protein SmpB [Dehalococcoidales bacterium]|nr:SsrA-binding protein SmpB [Dehalococcoidales bacterium]MDP7409644.1 SsrA-binding protein SmpB [Dehalococcoidales bacterium]